MAEYTLPNEEVVERITQMATEVFHSFGGGNANKGSLLGAVLKDDAASFALGVDIKEVVTMVLTAASHKTLQGMKEGNSENAIALTLNEAWEMMEASYEKGKGSKFGEYKRGMEDCLIEAGKKNGLSKNMWALLNLAMHWPNDCQCWCKDVLAGKDLLEECEKEAKDHEQEEANEARG